MKKGKTHVRVLLHRARKVLLVAMGNEVEVTTSGVVHFAKEEVQHVLFTA